ncbi:MAG: DciA family protein [Planctomycetota bacterium]
MPTPLGDALGNLIQARGIAKPGAKDALEDLWRVAAGDVVGSHVLAHTKVIGLHRGTLRVGVTSAALLGELSAFHRDGLAAALTADADTTGVKALKFELRGDLRDG